MYIKVINNDIVDTGPDGKRFSSLFGGRTRLKLQTIAVPEMFKRSRKFLKAYN